MAERSVEGLILTVWRTIADVTQKEADARTGFTEGSTSYYERKARPEPEVLEAYRLAYGFPPHMLRRTRDFVEEALASLRDASPPDQDEVARREFEERSSATFQELFGRLDAFAEAHLEHREAPYLWRRLERHTAEERLAMVKAGKDFWSPGLCVLVCEKSVEAAANDGREAEELSWLAVEIARRVPGGKARRARLEGLAQAFVGNALRVRGQLPSADQAFKISAELWRQGTGTFHELIDPSRVLDLEASLRRAQRNLRLSLDLLERAFPLARSARARGRILLLRAKALEEKGDHVEALAVLDEAEPYVFQAGDLHHIFAFGINRLTVLCNLDRLGEAAAGVKEIRALADRLHSAFHQTRVRWLEGRVAAGFGQVEKAVAALREVVDAFAARESTYDCALVLLEVAVLLLRQGKAEEVCRLTSQLEPVFEANGVHREALAALRLFVDAARNLQATVELAERVLDFLRRSRFNAEIRFGERYGAPSPTEGEGAWE